jgi:hypothetical protein
VGLADFLVECELDWVLPLVEEDAALTGDEAKAKAVKLRLKMQKA